jgi:nicotinamide mononucleotide transporter
VKDLTLTTLWADVQATSVAEWLAVVTGVIYILLIMRRQRAAWIMGGISSAILAVLAAQSRLPMQAALQVFYVLAAVYGWWRWAPEVQPQRVGTWSWRGHLLTLLVCVVVSVGLAHLLAREGVSAYPFLDSLLATTGLFATWLVARVYLENWLYWIVIDAVSLYLFLSQGLAMIALLFAIYLVIAALGLRSWWKEYQRDV